MTSVSHQIIVFIKTVFLGCIPTRLHNCFVSIFPSFDVRVFFVSTSVTQLPVALLPRPCLLWRNFISLYFLDLFVRLFPRLMSRSTYVRRSRVPPTHCISGGSSLKLRSNPSPRSYLELEFVSSRCADRQRGRTHVTFGLWCCISMNIREVERRSTRLSGG